MEFKKWKEEEVKGFCEDCFMEEEDTQALWFFIKDMDKVSLSMEDGEKDNTGNTKGILIIKIKESE